MTKPVGSDRRAFLKQGTLYLAASAVCRGLLSAEKQPESLRIGLVTDLHFADKPTSGSRHYRETEAKLRAAGDKLRTAKPNFIVELGDLIDAAEDVDTELGYLNTINGLFSQISERRHYVLGNHCVHTLNKSEFLQAVGQENSYHSFDAGHFHFVVLDSCFRTDGEPYGRKNFEWTDANIPETELDWLRSDLRNTGRPTIVFAHQRLDVENHYGVRNAAAVRNVLQESGRVSAVFQGHSHKNDYKLIEGIHYATLVAMVEGSGLQNNAFSVLHIAPNGNLRIEGFVKQNNYQWSTD